VPESYETVASVLRQYAEDVAILHATRTRLTDAPHVRLKHLLRFEERLAAHIDGLLVAGEAGWAACAAELERPRPGSVFAVTVLALEHGNNEQLTRMFALTEAVPESCPGLLAAFGWAAPARLRGVVANLLSSSNAFQRFVGVTVSAMHRVDPGIATQRRTQDPDARARARALRAAGELGLHQMVSFLAAAAEEDPDTVCRFWAAWSAVLLGDRERGLAALAQAAVEAADRRADIAARAFQVTVLAQSMRQSHDLLRQLAVGPEAQRLKIQGAALVGDPVYVPWLIARMGEPRTARLAGESFSLITGVDLAFQDLESKPPEQPVDAGPNDDRENPSVAMDEDDGLPWPDPQRVQDWWARQGPRFTPGERWFMGSRVDRKICLRVLREGFQRQRRLAALHMALGQSGTQLFECRAPAKRQTRELAQLA
jgi:uncharacterized protein (TIGR02270 family)